MSLLGGIGAYLNKRLTNAVTGVTFNQDAFEVAHAQPLKLSENSEDSTPEYLTEEEWSNLTRDSHRAVSHLRIYPLSPANTNRLCQA